MASTFILNFLFLLWILKCFGIIRMCARNFFKNFSLLLLNYDTRVYSQINIKVMFTNNAVRIANSPIPESSSLFKKNSDEKNMTTEHKYSLYSSILIIGSL